MAYYSELGGNAYVGARLPPGSIPGLPHVGDPGVMLIQGWSGCQLGRMDHDLWCGWPVDPPPLNWSTLKYVLRLTGGPKCLRSVISRKRSSPSYARSMSWSHRANPW